MGNHEKKGDFVSCSCMVGLEAPDFRRDNGRRWSVEWVDCMTLSAPKTPCNENHWITVEASRFVTVTWLDFYCVCVILYDSKIRMSRVAPLQKSSHGTVRTWKASTVCLWNELCGTRFIYLSKKVTLDWLKMNFSKTLQSNIVKKEVCSVYYNAQKIEEKWAAYNKSYVYRICRNKRPGRLIFRSNKKTWGKPIKTHRLWCTPPYRTITVFGGRLFRQLGYTEIFNLTVFL